MNKQRIVGCLKSFVRKIFKRDIVFLPPGGKAVIFDVTQELSMLPLQYTYRASSQGWITYKFVSMGTNLQYVLSSMEYSGRQPITGQPCISLEVGDVYFGDVLRVNLLGHEILLNDKKIECKWNDYKPSRKYIANFQASIGIQIQNRVCSHYLPYERKPISKDYYFGDDYTEYPLHTKAASALDLIRYYCEKGRLLDVGCALGIYTKAFLDAGFDAYGMDISEFAVSEAQKRISSERITQCDIDKNNIPFDAPFDIFWVWDVLEHLANPKLLLNKITEKASKSSYLFLQTSNADSLTHQIFGSDWEGYSDYSHYGIDQVTAKSLRSWLDEMDWEILEWKCFNLWIFGNDPVNAKLHDAFSRIPELKLFLSERELGDGLRVVARKRTRNVLEN